MYINGLVAVLYTRYLVGYAMPRVLPGYKEEAKVRILNAAAEVFSEKGYHKSTMDDVARRIGVSKGAVYLYFKSKSQLFEQMCEFGTKTLEDTLNSSFKGGNLLETASLYFDREMEQSRGGHALWLEFLAEAQRDKNVRKILEGVYTQYREILVRFLDTLKDKGTLDRNLDSESLARILMAFHDGILAGLPQGLDETKGREVWNEGVALLFGGSLRGKSR